MFWFVATKAAKHFGMGPKIAYIILNVIRALNLLAIAACIAASGSLLVKTSDFTNSIGWFNVFDLATKCLIVLFAMLLLITEFPFVLRRFIRTHWPHFGEDNGFGALSASLVFLGCNTLSYLAKKDADEKHLGGDFFRLVQAAGFMALIMAVMNFPTTYIFKNKRNGQSARQVRSDRSAQYYPEAQYQTQYQTHDIPMA